MSEEHDHSQAYVPLPARPRAARAAAAGRAAAQSLSDSGFRAVAVCAVAVAGAWLAFKPVSRTAPPAAPAPGAAAAPAHAPAAAQPPAPGPVSVSAPRPAESAPAPAVEPASARPSPADLIIAAAAAPAASGALSSSAPKPEAAAPRAAAELPAWARVSPALRWSWPEPLKTMRFSGMPALETDDQDAQRLASWDPAAPEGSRLSYVYKPTQGRTIEIGSVAPSPNGPRALSEEGKRAFAAEQEKQRRETFERLRREGANALAQGTLAQDRADGLLGTARKVEAEALAKQVDAAGVSRMVDRGGRAFAVLTFKDGRVEAIAYDPLVFDLRGGGVKTNARQALFDLAGTGQADKQQAVSDIDGGTGILVFNESGTGKSGKTGAEVFGDRTDLSGLGRPDGYVNGFEALRAMAARAAADGVLTASVLDGAILDAEALKALEKAYGLRMEVGGFNGRTVSLAEAGVRAIALSQAAPELAKNFDGRGNDLLLQPGAVFLRADGTTGAYANVFLAARTKGLGLRRMRAAP